MPQLGRLMSAQLGSADGLAALLRLVTPNACGALSSQSRPRLWVVGCRGRCKGRLSQPPAPWVGAVNFARKRRGEGTRVRSFS
jgi:hypothetical protein